MLSTKVVYAGRSIIPCAALLAAPRPGQIHPLGRPIQMLEPVGRNHSET
jgi:hypothetical protein